MDVVHSLLYLDGLCIYIWIKCDYSRVVKHRVFTTGNSFDITRRKQDYFSGFGRSGDGEHEQVTDNDRKEYSGWREPKIAMSFHRNRLRYYGIVWVFIVLFLILK